MVPSDDAESTHLLAREQTTPYRSGDVAYSRTSSSEWPAPEWDRYEPIEFLGAGGMGRVFKAWDRSLQRQVAIKLLTPGNPETVERFKREAQSQARVEHPNVCRVYEVGEVNGFHYIAMQLVDGVPLDRLADQLTLDEIAVLVRGAAEGVHAANRLGLVHRDVKPANIMVATGEDGQRQAFVVDFGLARDVAAPSHTLTDVVVGTPAYMAPEQARGRTVDRRTDVYGLGATLYALLGGKPPVVGESAAEMLLNLLSTEPESLRRRNPAIPRDLETIVMTCLASAPQERYESARALADDLGRFLDGEAVAAQPPSLLSRWARTARRNRSLVAVSAAGVLVAAVLLGLWLHAIHSATRQAELAQQFGHEVERIEGMLWRARSLPLHELTSTRQRAAMQIERLETEMRRAGRIAQEPGHAAIGQALYALYEFEEARSHLELAWDAGYRSPEVAETLARVHWELYRRAMGELKKIGDDELRAKRREEITRSLRDPAVRYLDGVVSAGGEGSSAGALRAALEGRPEEAIELARAAFDAEPWRLDAKVLEAAEEMLRAGGLMDRGAYAQAADALARSRAAAEDATRVGRSDLRAWETLCSTLESTLNLQVWRTGDATEDSHAAVVAVCTAAMEIAPDRHAARLTLAHALTTWSEHLWSIGQDPTASLEQVIELTEAVLDEDPDQLHALVTVGAAHWQRGKLTWLSGAGSPVKDFEAGAAVARRAVSLYPSDVQANLSLGLVLMELANYQMQTGSDPTAAADEAAAAFARAQTLLPRSAAPAINHAMVQMVLVQFLIEDQESSDEANFERVSALLDEAEERLSFALELDPASSWARRTMAEVLWYRGRLSTDDDELCKLTDRSIEHLTAAVEVRPSDAAAWLFLLRNRGSQVWCAAQRGDSERVREVAATARAEADAAFAAIPELDSPERRSWVEDLVRVP